MPPERTMTRLIWFEKTLTKTPLAKSEEKKLAQFWAKWYVPGMFIWPIFENLSKHELYYIIVCSQNGRIQFATRCASTGYKML